MLMSGVGTRYVDDTVRVRQAITWYVIYHQDKYNTAEWGYRATCQGISDACKKK